MVAEGSGAPQLARFFNAALFICPPPPFLSFFLFFPLRAHLPRALPHDATARAAGAGHHGDAGGSAREAHGARAIGHRHQHPPAFIFGQGHTPNEPGRARTRRNSRRWKKGVNGYGTFSFLASQRATRERGGNPKKGCSKKGQRIEKKKDGGEKNAYFFLPYRAAARWPGTM